MQFRHTLSWTEYMLISRSEIKGFDSGAAFGYNDASRENWTNGGGLLDMQHAGITGNLASSYKSNAGRPSDGTSYTNNNRCPYSRLTVANKDCQGSNPTTGNSSISVASQDIITARLLARYATTNADTPAVTNGINVGSLQAGIYKASGDFTISGGNIPKGRTISIVTSGTVTITGNIAYENTVYNDISELSQLLIFAGDIQFLDSVTNVDAMLIAGKQGIGNGHIVTCVRNSGSSYAAPIPGSAGYDSGICSNSLTVNGMVMAGRLISNRSAGAGIGNASSNPSEIFNARADSYLWAISQSQDFHQAVTSYMTSLPPRW
jgi:hypothetical protein